MDVFRLKECLTVFSLLALPAQDGAAAAPPPALASPIVKGPWVIPAGERDCEPVFGISNGISVGLWPMGGPRGLIRIYTPYVGQSPGRVINFIAVEPIVKGNRSFSELEDSASDGRPGKLMWTGSRDAASVGPGLPWNPAPPEFCEIEGQQAMRFWIFVESFHCGASPVIQIELRQDRPHEVTFTLFAAEGSEPMQSCILSATMGNYARLRRLWLKDKVIEAGDLWPDFRAMAPFAQGFAPHQEWGVRELFVREGEAIVPATPNEKDPAQAGYVEAAPPWFRYEGGRATQFWRAKADPALVARVNGRACYWGSVAEIPGGISFENFEMQCPFVPGQSFTFGVTQDGPESLF